MVRTTVEFETQHDIDEWVQAEYERRFPEYQFIEVVGRRNVELAESRYLTIRARWCPVEMLGLIDVIVHQEPHNHLMAIHKFHQPFWGNRNALVDALAALEDDYKTNWLEKVQSEIDRQSKLAQEYGLGGSDD